MTIEPTLEHLWLQRLVGDWQFENEAVIEPDKPPVKFTGRESVRSLAGLWMICEGEGEMPGGDTGQTIMTLGYDPAQKCFRGSFIGSMMTHLWTYRGALDETGTQLILDTEGPTFSDPNQMGAYQDIIEFKSDDHRILHSQFRDETGKWHRFMSAHYHRK